MIVVPALGDDPDSANVRYLSKLVFGSELVILTVLAEVALPDSAPLNVVQIIVPVPVDPTVSEGTDGSTINCLLPAEFEY